MDTLDTCRWPFVCQKPTHPLTHSPLDCNYIKYAHEVSTSRDHDLCERLHVHAQHTVDRRHGSIRRRMSRGRRGRGRGRGEEEDDSWKCSSEYM